jgi:hypothetical protein
MPSYIVYGLKGEILRNVSCPVSCYEQRPVDELWIEGKADDIREYIKDGAVTSKDALQPIISGNIVSNLPSPCTITIQGQSAEILDGEVELLFEVPGVYPFKLTAFPYLDYEGVVDAT